MMLTSSCYQIGQPSSDERDPLLTLPEEFAPNSMLKQRLLLTLKRSSGMPLKLGTRYELCYLQIPISCDCLCTDTEPVPVQCRECKVLEPSCEIYNYIKHC
jgi:hypothetical protein